MALMAAKQMRFNQFVFAILAYMFAGGVTPVQAVPPWVQNFGGSERDGAFAVAAVKGGGTIMVGYTRSKGAGNSDVWVMRLDEQGNRLWDKTFGGPERDMATAVTQMRDGGFAVAAFTYSKGAGRGDAWIIRLNR